MNVDTKLPVGVRGRCPVRNDAGKGGSCCYIVQLCVAPNKAHTNPNHAGPKLFYAQRQGRTVAAVREDQVKA